MSSELPKFIIPKNFAEADEFFARCARSRLPFIAVWKLRKLYDIEFSYFTCNLMLDWNGLNLVRKLYFNILDKIETDHAGDISLERGGRLRERYCILEEVPPEMVVQACEKLYEIATNYAKELTWKSISFLEEKGSVSKAHHIE